MAGNRPRTDRPASDQRETDALLEGVDLTCARGDRRLFEGFGFRLGPGGILQVEGANGSGKTSLLRILCLLSLPEAGEVRWNGANAEEVRPDYLGQLSYLGHSPGIKRDLSPRENLRVAAALLGGRTELIDGTLEQIGLGAHKDIPVRQLSAGQTRRTALARLQVQGTRVWILDEPLAGLDPEGSRRVEAMLVAHCGAGGMAVVSTHHPMDLPGQDVTRAHLDEDVRAPEEES